MYFRRTLTLMIVAAGMFPAWAQDAPPPAAILGPPRVDGGGSAANPNVIIDPRIDPLLRPLGSPDEPFRPFAPLGEPTNPLSEGIGRRFGLGILGAQYGMPGAGTTYIPSQKITNSTEDLAVLRNELSIFAPISNEGADSAALGLGIRNSVFFTDSVLPTTLRPFPGQTWDIQAGLAYSHAWDNGWTTGAIVSGGSASNKPFIQQNVLVASLVMYNAFPTDGKDAWILGFSYLPVSDSPYPLPILSYYFEPNEDLSVNIGVPFFLKYRFLEQATLDLVYVPIRNVSARITFQPLDFPNTRLYGGFNWSNEAVFLADRIDDDNRFYAYEKRLSGGIQFDLPWRLYLDVSAGYVFDRFYFQGKQYSDRNKDRVDVAPGVFGALQLRLKF